MRLQFTVTQDINLSAIPYRDWPSEAQHMARLILAQPRYARRFEQELPALRLSWLAAIVEQKLMVMWEL